MRSPAASRSRASARAVEQAAARRDLLPDGADLRHQPFERRDVVAHLGRERLLRRRSASDIGDPRISHDANRRRHRAAVRGDAHGVGAGRHHRPAAPDRPRRSARCAIFFAPSRARSHTARCTPGSVGSAFFSRASSSSSPSGIIVFRRRHAAQTPHEPSAARRGSRCVSSPFGLPSGSSRSPRRGRVLARAASAAASRHTASASHPAR